MKLAKACHWSRLLTTSRLNIRVFGVASDSVLKDHAINLRRRIDRVFAISPSRLRELHLILPRLSLIQVVAVGVSRCFFPIDVAHTNRRQLPDKACSLDGHGLSHSES